MDPWRVLRERRLLQRRWLTIHEQHVVLPTGAEIEEFHLIEAPDWVAMLVLADDGQVVLVEQYRHGLAGSSLELPAGVIDEGESVLDAARRELREETGYEAPEWRPLLTVSTEPSRHTNRAHFLFARGARRVGDPCMEAGEHIAVRLLDVDALLGAVDGGAIAHGLHVAAILLAERRGWLSGNGVIAEKGSSENGVRT